MKDQVARSTLDIAAIAAERARRGPATIKTAAHGLEVYEPDGAVLTKFLMSDNRVDIIQGPLGSGKTNALFRRIGRLKLGSPPRHDIAFGDVRIQIDFLALDDAEDIKKLRSAEYTGAAIHEAQYINLELFREIRSRVNRFPAEADGGATWSGVIADANASDEDHWLAMMTGQVDMPEGMTPDERRSLQWPSNWSFFLQPPATVKIRDARGEVMRREVNLDVENLRWLATSYYMDQLDGNSAAWIDNRLGNETILVVDGAPVWPMFRRDFHVAREALRPVRGHDVMVWLDFGRVYPAALFAQEINGRVNVQHEILGFNEGATIFAPKVKRFLEQHYEGCAFRSVGDPKGRDKGQATEQSSYDVFRHHGMPVTPAPVPANDISTRIEAVAYALNDNPRGVNRLVISPLCRTLIVGMAGRYHLVREEDGELRPKKDKYPNLCDCLQYGCLSLGEGRRMVGLKPPSKSSQPVSHRNAVTCDEFWHEQEAQGRPAEETTRRTH